ncbi:pirin family protein [Stutzerimonas kunmingensis]|uniref:Pirin family protein n=1 Tax=Stutzerimonas kunmingensis TaxID=1211807 RepID=A0A9X1N556_9GAMM|nr:pirin family protein [Stutzerimonas kunmingensis]MCD1609890.1 pirin family protein [Stutzerimonas kunmingensis]OHC17944.1 MAG: quercetin 2,3-dioxygenase [Pseudomonadales bacterium GWC2_63_15]PNF99420.1 quercetin 2,3-dioxygenase [Stutzerimonas kunmingensis]
MSQREILSITSGRATSDGAGVSLTRVFGGAAPERFDPFLMLDEFGSNDPDEYIAGFPPHPHRGFETITYMLEGRMRHEDHMGNVGLLESGGVQWMTAARGVIHSEMPQQQEGTMRGFQLWLNLPSHAKLGDPDYRDFAPAEIPQLALPGGVQAKVIAGVFKAGDIEQHGIVQRPDTEPLLFDLQLSAESAVSPQVPDGHRLLLYVYEGTLRVGEQAVSKGQLVQMSQDGELNLSSERGARLMLLAGRPLGEPIVQYGPFVMNRREEIEQALRDFRDGTLA